MRQYVFLLIVVCCAAWGQGARAQQLPLASPPCEWKQTIGLTDIAVKYHRPDVRGRQVWGKLVPYEKVWRTGANQATTISFTDDIWLNDLLIKAGTYAIFTIPQKKGDWTVMLNRNINSWGTLGFKDEDNLISFRARPYKVPFTETFTIEMANIGRSTADLLIRWERLALPIQVRVDLDTKVNQNIDRAIAAAAADWRVYTNCAEYCLRNNTRLGEARQWVEKAIQLNGQNFYPFWLKADLLALDFRFAEAIAAAQRALELGKAEQGDAFLYKADIERGIALWKSKVN